ncbi:MAG: DUF177 domain-containing protein [Desulfobulbaceae bacterium]|nr:DUF177 domain-containing protein [Desulfobulbaceae bacterium]
MKVVLASLTRREKLFALADDGWFPSEAVKTGGVAATARLRRLDTTSWSLAGRLCVTLSLSCDRCGRAVPLPVDDEFVHQVVAGTSDGEADAEVDDENAAQWLVTGSALDLAEVFRERVLLALPEKVLCAEDCRGLCAGCGADLNQEPCRCQ